MVPHLNSSHIPLPALRSSSSPGVSVATTQTRLPDSFATIHHTSSQPRRRPPHQSKLDSSPYSITHRRLLQRPAAAGKSAFGSLQAADVHAPIVHKAVCQRPDSDSLVRTYSSTRLLLCTGVVCVVALRCARPRYLDWEGDCGPEGPEGWKGAGRYMKAFGRSATHPCGDHWPRIFFFLEISWNLRPRCGFASSW